ncbi:hypothetical protein SEA_SOOS_70 [Gordonia phage Soos]|nr:hypothetical protein SEA_SOOS_70 [Gordonia phage Soos]
MSNQPEVFDELIKPIALENQIQVVVLDGRSEGIRQVVAVSNEHGLQTEILDEREQLREPLYVDGERYVSDAESFLQEIQRKPLPGSDSATFWGVMDSGVITLIYDDHTSTKPGNRSDRLTLKLQSDEDWRAWHNLSGKAVPQEQLGDYLEDLAHTIVQPSAAEMLEVVDSIRASTKGEFESKIERSSGSVKIGYSQDTTAKAGRKGQLEVPSEILLRLRPWEGHNTFYDVPAHFRFRVRDGELSLSIKLKPTRQILRRAWADLTDQIEKETGEYVRATTQVTY